MKFWVPDCGTFEEALRACDEVKRRLSLEADNRRIRSLKYSHKGKIFTAEVGTTLADYGLVYAVFGLHKGSYAVCTEHRGWKSKLPVYTGGGGRDDSIINVIEFEA